MKRLWNVISHNLILSGTIAGVIVFILGPILLKAVDKVFSLDSFASIMCFLMAKHTLPLWGTIVICIVPVLLAVSIRGLIDKNRQSQGNIPYNRTEEDLITVGRFKWKVLHANGHIRHISGLPYCIEHEYQLIPRDTDWVCPKPGCKSILSNYDLDKVRVAAFSIIENVIRNKKY